jgi:hypothetical protein
LVNLAFVFDDGMGELRVLDGAERLH